MNTLITVLFAIILCQSIDGFRGLPRPEHYIVNGQNVEIKDIPYQVSVRVYGTHICGGSIISKTIILTAAHCINDFSVTFLTVRVGSTHRDLGIEIKVSNVLWHEDFSSATYDSDIGLLKLKQSLVFSQNIRPVELVEPNFVLPYGQMSRVSGWGLLWQGGPSPTTLQAANVTILETQRCADNYKRAGYVITSNMFCAGSVSGRVDSCQGDSDGPLTYGNYQIGIVSWGLGCAQRDLPGVYTSVSKLRNWIDKRKGVL